MTISRSLYISRYRNLYLDIKFEPWHKIYKGERERDQEVSKMTPWSQLRWNIWAPEGNLTNKLGYSPRGPGLALCPAHTPLLSIKTGLWPYIQKPALGRHRCRICWFIRGHKEQQIWQEWHSCCWQLCSALGCKTLREAGQKCFDALWRCLNEHKLCKGPTGRSMNGIIESQKSSRRDGARDVSYVPSTQSLELFPVYSGTRSIFIGKKEKAHLGAWSTIEKDNLGREGKKWGHRLIWKVGVQYVSLQHNCKAKSKLLA